MAETIDGMRCPVCGVPLVRELCTGGSRPTCPKCRGRAITVALLRRFAPLERAKQVWRLAAIEGEESKRPCPGCRKPMRAGTLSVEGSPLEIDGCRRCQLLWFDPTELSTLSPQRQEPLPDEPDPHAESHARWLERQREIYVKEFMARLPDGARPRNGPSELWAFKLLLDVGVIP